MATPATGTAPPSGGRDGTVKDRRLRLDDILKLMVADGLVSGADAERLSRSHSRRFEHPLELVASENWKSARPPQIALTLEWLVEWLAGKLGVRYYHIDPLKIDLAAVTQTMSNAYAERFRILPVAVTRD